jgi:hypothetical protein
MRSYTDLEARENLAAILEEAREYGAVQIRRRDGTTFVLSFQQASSSPLDVVGVDTDITAQEILGFIQEGRRLV